MRGIGGLKSVEFLGNNGVKVSYAGRDGEHWRFEPAGSGFLTIQEAAMALGTNALRLYRRIKTGKLKVTVNRGIQQVSVRDVHALRSQFRGRS